MDRFDLDAQPICPACGVTTQPGEDADECWECGYRIETEADEDPAHVHDSEHGVDEDDLP